MPKVFVVADWMNLEGRLTAHFSKDKRLTEMLAGELEGKPKVHALTAEMLYGCDPYLAKKMMINLQGNEVTAYYGGKRLRHGWHYGMKPRKMAQTFWIELKEAIRIDDVMRGEHPGIVNWWKELGDEVFGVHKYRCPRCDTTREYVGGDCPTCELTGGRFVPKMRWDGWARTPERVLYTPFGRRRIYLGRRAEGMNALISQQPQSCGASMWYRTLNRLHGIDIDGGKWPIILDARVWWEQMYSMLVKWSDGYETQVITGTYDSFVMATDAERVDDVVQWLTWTMEQPWPELGGLRIPADVEVGYNWGSYDAKTGRNPNGLRAYEYRPFSACRP
jgi:hypothetical protein